MYLYAQPHWYKAVKSSFKMLWIYFLALTTVEGVLQAAIDGLGLDQPVRKVSIHPCHLYITAQQISKNIIKISLKSQSDFFAIPVLKMIRSLLFWKTNLHIECHCLNHIDIGFWFFFFWYSISCSCSTGITCTSDSFNIFW